MRSKIILIFSVLLLGACSKTTTSFQAAPEMHQENVDPVTPSLSPQLKAPTQAPSVAPGTDVGSGMGVLDPRDDAAWFLGTARIIKTCLLINPKFSFSEKELKAKLQWAFDTWSGYAERQVDIPSRFIPFAHRLEFQTSCDGTQDFTVSFGEALDAVKPHLERLHQPPAVTVRESYDLETSWGKGVLWVAPPGQTFSDLHGAVGNGSFDTTIQWNEPGFLDATLLHEVGHIFGVGHIAGTIMDEKLVMKFARHDPAILKYFYQIDNETELRMCVGCEGKVYQGIFGSSFKEEKSNAKEFFGVEKLAGNLSVEFRLGEGFSSSASNHTLVVILPSGDAETFEIVTTGKKIWLSTGLEPIFRQWQKSSTALNGEAIGNSPSAMILHGYLVDKRGKKQNLLIKRNIDYATPLQISLLKEDGTEVVIFSAYSERIISHFTLQSALEK